MKPILYHYTLCPLSRKIRFLMEELGIEYTKKEIEFWKNEEIFKFNIIPECPVLYSKRNNILIQDSYLISEYLLNFTKRYDLYGEDQYKVKRLIMLFDKNFYDEVTKIFLYEKIYCLSKKIDFDKIRYARENLKKYLLFIEKTTDNNDYTVENKLTLADITIAAQISTLDFFGEINFNKYLKLKKWYLLVKSRPAFDTILQDRNILLQPPPHYKKVDF